MSFPIRFRQRLKALNVLAGVGSLLFASACGSNAGTSSDAPARNVLLVTVDTLRADYLGCYGGPVPTPRLDALAAQGIVFEKAYSQATHTHAALSAMLTGMVPPKNGVGVQTGHLAEGVQSVASMLQSKGIQTASFVANLCQLQSIPDNVLSEGWDHTFCGMDLKNEKHGAEQYLWDELIVSEAIDWMQNAEGPWFVWVHMMDPHAEHRPSPDFWDYASEPLPSKRDELFRHGALEKERSKPPQAEWDLLLRRYSAEIQGSDRLVGELMDYVDTREDADRTGLIFSADHGEELFETWAKVGHGLSLTEGVLHVPLIVRRPGTGEQRAHASVEGFVETLQVTPTLLELFDVAPSGSLDGPSLLGDPLGGSASDQRDFAVSFCSEVATLRTDNERFYWKVPVLRRLGEIRNFLSLAPHQGETPWFQRPRSLAEYELGKPELEDNQPTWADLKRNPGHQRAADLQAQLSLFIADLGQLPGETSIKSAAFEEQLRALGYLGDEGEAEDPPKED